MRKNYGMTFLTKLRALIKHEAAKESEIKSASARGIFFLRFSWQWTVGEFNERMKRTPRSLRIAIAETFNIEPDSS